MVRFGTDSSASEGKESKQPPPPQALSLPLKRVLFPSDICPKQFWDFSRKFPEIFRNISNIFRYFACPLFIVFHDLRSLFATFSNIFRYLNSERFRNISNIFRYISGIVRDTFGPVPVHVRTIALQLAIPGTLNVAEPQPVVSQRGTFHQCSVRPPQNKRL